MKIIRDLFEIQNMELGGGAAAGESRKSVEALRKGIPEPILAHYDRLMARGKKAVALVERGVCTGCRMKLASGNYAKLLHEDDISVCDTCGRYLLPAPEPQSPPPPSQAPRGKTTAKRRGPKKSGNSASSTTT